MPEKRQIAETAFLVLFVFVFWVAEAKAGLEDCKNGYVWKPNTGVGCVQENCNDVPGAHWGYVGDCVCGSAGSINEKPDDPNKSCRYPNSHEACPGCVYACVKVTEKCPDVSGAGEKENQEAPQNQKDPEGEKGSDGGVSPGNEKNSAGLPVWVDQAPALSAQSSTGAKNCQKECEKLKRGGSSYEILEVSGKHPNCKCSVDVKDELDRLVRTIVQDGDKRTIYEFDVNSGGLKDKKTISMDEEREKILSRLGYKYNEEQIDALLSDEKIDAWFDFMMEKIETKTSMLHPQFWWQHLVAILDHGYENSADFVDIQGYGRCGDSMLWLERNLSYALKLNGKSDNKSEAILSITGEKYKNFINHTALMVRPSGVSSAEWADLVSELTTKTRSGGLSEKDLKNLDPRLLEAKVLDPYFKKKTTVGEFIKGWGVIKIS